MEKSIIQLWFADLTQGDYSKSWALLSPSERYRAESLKVIKVRQRFVISRAILRQLLADYMGVNCAAVELFQGPFGKPYVRQRKGEQVVFNLSHTGDHLVIALGCQRQIGIDIEVCRKRVNLDSLAEKCFSDSELRQWQQLESEDKKVTFYRIWTRKESFVKAVGRGISLGLKLCEMSIRAPVKVLSVPNNCGQPSDWRVIDLNVPLGLSAAMTTDGSECKLIYRYW
jgi:4'-phosphopantetheinyl transferase